MMTLTNSSRYVFNDQMTITMNCVRKRQCTEDADYMPVTKRMNSLHIDVITNG